jgi:hypothetical protein
MELLGLLAGFTSSKVADTTFAGSRGCRVCVSPSDELGITLTAHELSVAQSDPPSPSPLDRVTNPSPLIQPCHFIG